MIRKNSPVLKPRWKWFLMRVAKKYNKDIVLGKKFGWDYDTPEFPFTIGHWHFKHPPYVVYRDEY